MKSVRRKIQIKFITGVVIAAIAFVLCYPRFVEVRINSRIGRLKENINYLMVNSLGPENSIKYLQKEGYDVLTDRQVATPLIKGYDGIYVADKYSYLTWKPKIGPVEIRATAILNFTNQRVGHYEIKLDRMGL